jgi:hypothetical protein
MPWTTLEAGQASGEADEDQGDDHDVGGAGD